MKKIKFGNYSNGQEEFFVKKIINGIVYLFTRTGVKFLNAKKNSAIKIGEENLNDFYNNELKDFKKNNTSN
jgi:hypothetical protein